MRIRVTSFALALLLPHAAEAYVRTRTSSGHPVRWNGACATMSLGREDNPRYPADRLRAAFASVVAAWEDGLQGCAPLGITLGDEATRTSEVGFDGTNLLRWRLPGACDDPSQQDSEICRSPNAAAITTVFFVDRPGDAHDGDLLEVDLELNAVAFEFSDDGDPKRMDMQNTLSHEIGHVMGLDHTCFTLRGGAPPFDSNNDRVPYCFPVDDLPASVTETTMFNFADPGETKKRRPGRDEVAAVCEVYADRPATCTAPEMPGCGCETGAGGVSSLLAGLVTFLLSMSIFSRRGRLR